MVALQQGSQLLSASFLEFESVSPRSSKLGFARFSVGHNVLCNSKLNLRFTIAGDYFRSRSSPLVAAVMKESATSLTNNSSGISGDLQKMPCNGKSTNIVWHKNSIGKFDRQELLQQKGCVIWITGLSGSGKSTLACALSQCLHSKGKFTYVLDGDNIRHGLNSDLTFKAEDRVENIRRTGEVAKLFADAGIICIACLISPYRKDRDRCRALLPEGDFIEVFMDASLQVCESRDPKGLYKLARAGKIKGFTGIDDPYEPPLNCEISLKQKEGLCASPCDMAETVVNYLEDTGYMQA